MKWSSWSEENVQWSNKIKAKYWHRVITSCKDGLARGHQRHSGWWHVVISNGGKAEQIHTRKQEGAAEPGPAIAHPFSSKFSFSAKHSKAIPIYHTDTLPPHSQTAGKPELTHPRPKWLTETTPRSQQHCQATCFSLPDFWGAELGSTILKGK